MRLGWSNGWVVVVAFETKRATFPEDLINAAIEARRRSGRKIPDGRILYPTLKLMAWAGGQWVPVMLGSVGSRRGLALPTLGYAPRPSDIETIRRAAPIWWRQARAIIASGRRFEAFAQRAETLLGEVFNGPGPEVAP